MIYPSDDKPRENEISAWTVSTGVVSFFKKRSREAVKFIQKQKGFIGIHPVDGYSLWLFDTKENAMKARRAMDDKGIVTGDNIVEVFIDKRYIDGRKIN